MAKDKLQDALDAFDKSINSYADMTYGAPMSQGIVISQSTGDTTLSLADSDHSHGLYGSGWLSDNRKENLEKFVAEHRAYGYGWFLEVEDEEAFLDHEEWCHCESRYDASIGYKSGWPLATLSPAYWRAFKDQRDAAAFMLAFEAKNLLQLSFDEENW